VLAIIAILAVTTAMYGRNWMRQYQLSNFLRATEGAIRMTRMQAITQGRDCALIVSSNSLDPNTHLLTAQNFDGDYVAVGPYNLSLDNPDLEWKKYFQYVQDCAATCPSCDDKGNYNCAFQPAVFPVGIARGDVWATKVYYLLYNSKLYTVSDVSVQALGALDRVSPDNFNIKFNSRGFPWIYSGVAPQTPQAYATRSVSLLSKNLPNVKGYTVTVTPTGKVE
jgi:hypothetical protein